MGEALHIVRMLSCLVASRDVSPLKDDSVPIMANVGGTGSVLGSCVIAMCMLYVRVCSMHVAAEMMPQRSPHHQSLLQLLTRLQDFLFDAAKVTCCSASLACGGGTMYRDIVSSTHLALQKARLPTHLCQFFLLSPHLQFFTENSTFSHTKFCS